MKKLQYIIAALTAAFLISCEKTIEFKGKILDPLIVVNELYRQDEAFNVKITKSISSLEKDNVSQAVSNAIVTLYKNDTKLETIPFTEKIDSIYECPYQGDCKMKYINNGYYQSGATAEPGNTYKLKVNIDGYDEVIAENYLPEPVAISRIDTTHKIDKRDDYETKNFIAKISVNDPADEENFYEFTAYRLSFQKDTSQGYAQYFPTYMDQAWPRTDDKIINPESADNFIFSSYKRYMTFNDDLWNGQNHTFHITLTDYTTFYNDTYYEEYRSMYYDVFLIDLRTLSKEYYHYLTTCDAQNNGEEGFTEPVIVYNNIENGVGIFSGYSSDHDIVWFGDLPNEIQQMLTPENLPSLLEYYKQNYPNYNY